MSHKANGRKKLTPVEAFDIAVIERLTPLIDTKAGRAIGAVGDIGDQPPLLALSALVLGAGLWRRDARLSRTGAAMILAHLAATAAKGVGKDHVDRSRPRQLIHHDSYTMTDGTSKEPALRSFPSGHTAGAVALACAVARNYPRHRAAAYGSAALIGALQLPRKAHFLTDILAGMVIGAAAEQATSRLLARFEDVVLAPPPDVRETGASDRMQTTPQTGSDDARTTP